MEWIPLRLLWLLEHLRCQEMTNKRHGTALQLEMSAQDKISQNSEHSASQPQWALICMPITFYSSQLEEIRWKVQPEATYWTRFCGTMVRLFHPEDIFVWGMSDLCEREDFVKPCQHPRQPKYVQDWSLRHSLLVNIKLVFLQLPPMMATQLWLPILKKRKGTPWFLSIETKCQVLFSRAAGLVRPQIECLPASPGCVAQR